MFDAANRQTCTVRSSRTSTPLHALTTLNDPTWVEAARLLAERSMREESDPSRRLSIAFRRVVGRHAADDDLEALARLFEAQHAIYRADADAARSLLAVGEAKRDESLDPAEHAALTAVCLAILNLDESLTRE